MLDALKKSDWPVREVLPSVLFENEDPRVLPAMLTLVNDKAWQVREAVCSYLSICCPEDKIDPSFILLRDENPGVRMSAANIFVTNPTTKAIKPLINALADEDPDVV